MTRHDPAWLHWLLVSRGGFTLEARSGRPVRDGFAVCAAPAETFCCRLEEWNGIDVERWIHRRRPHLTSGAIHLGGWLEPSGNVSLDLVNVVPQHERERAMTIGKRLGQRAIFDLRRRELVPLTNVVAR